MAAAEFFLFSLWCTTLQLVFGPTLQSQLAACISGNDVVQDLAQLTDNIADILWCS